MYDKENKKTPQRRSTARQPPMIKMQGRQMRVNSVLLRSAIVRIERMLILLIVTGTKTIVFLLSPLSLDQQCKGQSKGKCSFLSGQFLINRKAKSYCPPHPPFSFNTLFVSRPLSLLPHPFHSVSSLLLSW